MSISHYWVVFVSVVHVILKKTGATAYISLFCIHCFADRSTPVHWSTLFFHFCSKQQQKLSSFFTQKRMVVELFEHFFVSSFCFQNCPSFFKLITFWLYDHNNLGQFIQLYYLQCQLPCWCYFIFFSITESKLWKAKKTIIY